MKIKNIGDIFPNCPAEVKKQVVYENIRKGEFLTLQDQEEEYVYIILNGSTKVYNIFPNGSLCQIAVFSAVDFIGEMEALLDAEAIHMAEANEDCYAAKLPRKVFLSWVNDDPMLDTFLLRHSQERLADLARKLMILRQLSSIDRLYMALYQFAPISKPVLQDEIAVSPRTLNRLLQKEAAKGMILVKDGLVSVLKPQEVEKRALGYAHLLPAKFRKG